MSFGNPTVHPVARLLPPEEWSRIPAFAELPPAHSLVVAVEDGGPGGPILAHWAAMTAAHVEGLHVEANYRGHAGVSRALLTCMVTALTDHGLREVLTQADTPEVEQLLGEIGGKRLPGSTWVVALAPKEEV